MNKPQIDIPVPVLEYPHWRVNFRPGEYEEQLIPTLGKCIETVERTKLSLRGWDYPHLSNRPTEREYGKNWVSSWSNFMGYIEYWRFYQSGQFIHLFSVGEATRPGWQQKLENDMKAHLSYMDDINWEEVPGYISIINFVYSMTEIFEFAARLCQAEVYKGIVNISVELKDVKGFVLSADWDRAWPNYCVASANEIGQSWSLKSDVLVSESAEHALAAIAWFFERFGWLSPSLEAIRGDQENLLKGRF